MIDSLKAHAAKDKGTSVRFVVLSAPKAYGVDIDEDKLIKDKRRDRLQ